MIVFRTLSMSIRTKCVSHIELTKNKTCTLPGFDKYIVNLYRNSCVGQKGVGKKESLRTNAAMKSPVTARAYG